MAVSPRPLWTAQAAPTAQTTMYTAATGQKVIIDKLTAYNSTGSPQNYTVNIVPSGGSAGATNVIVSKALAAGETFTFPEVIGHVLESGGFISVVSASASVIHRASGREIT